MKKKTRKLAQKRIEKLEAKVRIAELKRRLNELKAPPRKIGFSK